MMPKAKTTEKEGMLDFIKVENVCVSKHTIQEFLLLLLTEGIFANPTVGNGVLSKIWKGCLQFNNTETA